MQSDITISTAADWDQIRQEKLKVVIDPMVFRTADVFLRGEKGSVDPASMWTAISSNIGSLCTFFDSLILEARLPMYDYGRSFPPDIQTGKHALVEYCNESEYVLVSVTVKPKVYEEIKGAAITALEKLPAIPNDLAGDILKELSAFDWEWRPDLWRDEKTKDPERQRVLDAFRYGGILFSGYAQRTGSDHILQPKRAGLYLATSLGISRANDEKELFSELSKIAGRTSEGVQRTGDLPETPTFLPYLLKHDDTTPRALLQRALAFRKLDIVSEYRHWRKETLEDINKGRVLTERRKEIADLAAALVRELRAKNDGGTKVSAKVGVKVAAVGPEIGAEIGLEKELDWGASIGWLLRNVPGYRYRKLLMRLIIAQREYLHIDRHLHAVWKAA